MFHVFSKYYSLTKMAGLKRRFHTDMEILALHKDLDEVSCPICMDHPHNAVLILCSSNDKGCRPYICDTSYRHSNCLDRFKGQTDSSRSSIPPQSTLPTNSFNSISHADTSLSLRTYGSNVDEHHHLNENNDVNFVDIPEGLSENASRDPRRQLGSEGFRGFGPESSHGAVESEATDIDGISGSSLKCPLCRGDILGWEIVEEARKYLNSKSRSCSRESCTFSGDYEELRRHARRVHPATRPSDVDPSRERAWRSLERQREYNDIVSAIRSAVPGAVVVGDYVIENGNRSSVEIESRMGHADAPFWTTFLLFQIGSIDHATEPRSRSRGWMRRRHSARGFPERQSLWGENLLGLEDDDSQEVHIISYDDSSPITRRRRRLNRTRSDDQQT